MVKDINKWDADREHGASRFDAEYYGNLLEKAWKEVAFIFEHNLKEI